MLSELYLHFPFCVQKCLYCDFCSAPADTSVIRAYCNAMANELKERACLLKDTVIDTVFLGGGTPSLVPADCIRTVFEAIRRDYDLSSSAEITSEANPGTLTGEWLDTVSACGLNRLSLGFQSTVNARLKLIGRIHSCEEAIQSIAMARRYGIRNLNLDMMSGLPGQSTQEYLDSLRTVISLSPEHISAYSLILEDGTPLERAVSKGLIALPDEDTCADQYEQGRDLLENCGYHQYEISNFARPGRECRHNIGYWTGVPYLGIGIAAHSMLPAAGTDTARIRFANTADLHAYINANGMAQDQVEKITEKEAQFETVMLGLRMTKGVSEKHFQELHGISFHRAFGKTADSLIARGLAFLTVTDGERCFALTKKGLEMQNRVLTEFMSEA